MPTICEDAIVSASDETVNRIQLFYCSGAPLPTFLPLQRLKKRITGIFTDITR
jgi:hypothetical protein